MSSRVERYLAHLDRLSGGMEPVFQPVPSEGDLPDVTVMIYRDLPEPGDLTAITYGLSLAEHPEWRHGRPELCLSVRSGDPAWGHAAGWLAGRLRGDCPFRYGDTVDFGERVSPESAMTSFFVFAPFRLDVKDYADIRLDQDGHDVVHLAGLYPIHDVEREYIHRHGLEDFWHRDWNPADVTRPPCVP